MTNPQYAPEGVIYSIERISPADARELLVSNTRNRELNPRVVNDYLRAMEDGNWHFTGESITFDSDGVLNNGQHTLSAVARMPDDYRIDLLVVQGVTAVSQQFSDQGHKRTLAHLLGMNGVRNATRVASIGKNIYLWEEGLFFRDNDKAKSVTNVELNVWLAERPEIEDWVSQHGTSLRRMLVNPEGPFAAALFIIEKHSPVKGVEFRKALLSQNRSATDDTLKALDRQLLAFKETRVNARDMMGTVFLAWNYWITGKRRTTLGVPKIVVPEGATKALPRWTIATFPRPIEETDVKGARS